MHSQKKFASERARARRPRATATCSLVPYVSRALYRLLSPEGVVPHRLRFELERTGDAPEFVWRDARIFPRLRDFEAFLEAACEWFDIADEELLVAVVLFENFLRKTHRTWCPHVVVRQLLLICLCLAMKVANDDENSLYGDAMLGLTRASSRTLCRAEAYVLDSLHWTLSLQASQYELYQNALAECVDPF